MKQATFPLTSLPCPALPRPPGKPLDHAYKSENLELVRAGCANLERHVRNAARYGVPVVVALNRFATDTDAELEIVKQAALAAGQEYTT